MQEIDNELRVIYTSLRLKEFVLLEQICDEYSHLATVTALREKFWEELNTAEKAAEKE